MNALINATPNQTMSSREIADLCQKEHKNVLRVIRDLIDGQILAAQIEPLKFEYRGQWFDYYELNKRDSLVTVARLSPEFTAAVVDRWQELEAKAPAIPQTLPEALRLAADLAEQKAVVEQQLAIAAPKAVALDRIADTESLFTIREAAKAIKMKERDLVAELLRRGWAYRDGRNVMQPYAEKIAVGYVTSVMTKPITGTDGQDRVFTQLRITAKGVTRLSYLAAKGIAA